MDNYLVDVPVKINVWIRPECQRKQFEVIRKVKPSILFIVSDGGRNEEEKNIIRNNRKIVENIDWNCKIYKLYEDKNHGMYAMAKKAHELVWSHVDRCIFLEDDILPSESYFKFCEELLERFKDDKRINVICGMNHLGIYQDVNTDYFFSRQGSIWGYATWRRTYEQYMDFAYAQDSYILKLLKQRTRHNHKFWKRIKGYTQDKYFEGHLAWSEFFLEFAMYGHNQLQIIPKKNMICNIGCNINAAHSDDLNKLPRGIRQVFNMKTYQLEFPMKHAKYVIPDIYYEKERNKIMAYNCPFRTYFRRIETIFLKIKYRDYQGIKKMICRVLKKIRGRRNVEK